MISLLKVQGLKCHMRIFTDIELEDRPPLWENELPLAKVEPLPLEAFPIIDDFEIALERIKDASRGYGVAFFSEKRGFITYFPDWEHAELDLYRPSFSIPSYSIPSILYEIGWELEIFDEAEFTYVLESNFNHPEAGYSRWFRVPKKLYLAEWQAAIEASRQIVYLANREYNEEKNKR